MTGCTASSGTTKLTALLAVLAFLLGVEIMAQDMQVTWECVSEKAAFSPRDTAEPFVFQDHMWLSNGYYHGNKLSRDLWKSPDGNTWTQVSDATPYDGYSEMVVFKDRIWAVKKSVWSSADGVTWDKVLDKTPFGVRGYGELVVFKGRMWQLGCGADVWSTADGKTWTCVQKSAPYGKRAASAVTVFQNKLWLFGGRTSRQNDPPEQGYKQFTTFQDVWCSGDGVQWTRVVEKAPWPRRMWFPVMVYRDKLWLLGGYDNANKRNVGDVWCSDDGKQWRKGVATGEVFSGRHEPSCYIFADALWLVAGNAWPVQSDVWRLKLAK